MDVPLVVGGRQGWLTDETFAAVKGGCGLEGRVRFAGFIDYYDLPAVMSQAALFCFPSGRGFRLSAAGRRWPAARQC